MLVLARKTGEQIRIGENVILSVLEIHGNSVKLGIQAPADIAIKRLEIVEVKTQQDMAGILQRIRTAQTDPRTQPISPIRQPRK